jgi:putative tricarboxylic transport membrane protein
MRPQPKEPSDRAEGGAAQPSVIAPPMPMIAHATLDVDTEQALPAHAEHDRSTALASVVLGGLMVLAAVVVLVDAASLRPGTATVGPAAAPTVVGVLLGLVGAVLALRGWWDLRKAGPGPGLGPRGRLLRLAAMVGLLVAFALLLPVVGYVVASTLLFTGAALLLGAPHPLRTLAYGWTLAAVAFLVFDKLIGLALPVGPWGF